MLSAAIPALEERVALITIGVASHQRKANGIGF
jgi:hypothetical protein